MKIFQFYKAQPRQSRLMRVLRSRRQGLLQNMLDNIRQEAKNKGIGLYSAVEDEFIPGNT